MLCVICIIGILVGMMLGPISRAHTKAKAAIGADEATTFHRNFVEAMQDFYRGQPIYGRLTVADLQARGVLSIQMVEFMRKNKAEFYPFSSQDPKDKLILFVPRGRYGPISVLKADVIVD